MRPDSFSRPKKDIFVNDINFFSPQRLIIEEKEKEPQMDAQALENLKKGGKGGKMGGMGMDAEMDMAMMMY